MKYVKVFHCALLFAFLGGLSACAVNDQRQGWNYDGSQPVDLVATEQFLPVQERDQNGQLLPYQAMPNPYSSLEGQLEKDTVTRYIGARRAYKASEYGRAEEMLGRLVTQQPQLSGPLVLRGDVATRQGKHGEAVEHYVAAIKVNPINFNAWLRLAKVQRMRGHFKHAQNTYARALNKWPDGPELHLNLGVLYDLYLNEPLKAQAHMEAYQLLSGDNSGDVVAWLKEIRSRTGVETALKVIDAGDKPASRISRSDRPKPQASADKSLDLQATEGEGNSNNLAATATSRE